MCSKRSDYAVAHPFVHVAPAIHPCQQTNENVGTVERLTPLTIRSSHIEGIVVVSQEIFCTTMRECSGGFARESLTAHTLDLSASGSADDGRQYL